jgi:hypothetical protein
MPARRLSVVDLSKFVWWDMLSPRMDTQDARGWLPRDYPLLSTPLRVGLHDRLVVPLRVTVWNTGVAIDG